MAINLKNYLNPPTKMDAILSIRPEAQINEAGDEIIWHDENPTNITEEQITTKLAELTTEWEAIDYARKRKAEYPTIEELVVALYDTDDKSAIEAKRAEVKAKYPK
mgnify:CR=1 FL=1